MEYVAMIGLLFAGQKDLLHLPDLRRRVPGDLRRAEAPVPLYGVNPQCPKKIPGLTASAAGPGDFFTFR